MIKKLFFPALLLTLILGACEKSDSGLSSGEGSGKTGSGGSMAKFTFSGNYLYVVDGRILNVYDVSSASETVLRNRIDLENSGVETIFNNGSNLFFGTQTGMLIFGLSNPEKPNYISTYSHIMSCDPVVVSGNLAYVTLSTGNTCARGMNQLEVIDISDLSSPQLMAAYAFGNPKGLAVAGNYLYLCDAQDGFKVLDISDPYNVKTKSTLGTLLANDVIAKGDRLTITAADGVYQYDCSDPLSLKFISKIKAQ